MWQSFGCGNGTANHLGHAGITSWFDALDSRPYVECSSPRSETSVLRLLEWSHEGHRYRAELRDVGDRRVWFLAIDDEFPREAFEASDADENENALRARVVRAVRLTDLG